jgi:glycosyltransferase involved in cell wall biosynthesis
MREEQASPRLRVAYHGPIHDISGYGTAARAYLNAFRSSGIDLIVVDSSTVKRPQMECEASPPVGGWEGDIDFHLFHGVPPQWKTMGLSPERTVGMTVWETNQVPEAWLDPIRAVRELWIPCGFNAEVFGPATGGRVFELPHPTTCGEPGVRRSFPAIRDHEFLVYSIFEWQPRKSPIELMETYLRAFQNEEKTVFLVKTNPAARQAAQDAVKLARSLTGSGARIELYCETWQEEQIRSLHQRGDCYLSLHRGEGWCYPLFDAACHGTPAVATAYSGPLEYLDPEAHYLVPWRSTPVLQKYTYYDPRMKWAEPDCDVAVAKLRAVYRDRICARKRATEAAVSLRSRYSPSEIGRQAKERLILLLQKVGAAA